MSLHKKIRARKWLLKVLYCFSDYDNYLIRLNDGILPLAKSPNNLHAGPVG